ncbi:helix-turn-helix domain-containing protein [Alkalihalobacillus macyae]|uniref:helix-turn-helix domain-containing protein n=1 Tax=Guptibacillus hwajinpoensis TaxID=208199 RepID=UPI00273BDB90|nr:helix-turn-helix domain-containing protein [Alkalihalobacillus macyae]MDP4550849.1 helix-turn-helix domain-containing protein [Alkalihalobacillus macyae]
MPYYDDYERYQSFQTLEALNEGVRKALYFHADKLNKTAVTVLKTISRYSCKIPGVSWLKAATLAELIEKSEKTIRRALKTLEQLGIIQRIPTVRAKGGRGYDVCIIRANIVDDQSQLSSRSDLESPCASKDERSSRTKETAILKAKIIRQGSAQMDYTFAPANVPEEFVKAVRPFFGDAPTIYSLWGRVIIAHRHAGIQASVYDAVDTAIVAFKQTIFSAKAGRLRGTVTAYYYGTLRGMLAVIRRQEVGYSSVWLRREVMKNAGKQAI